MPASIRRSANDRRMRQLGAIERVGLAAGMDRFPYTLSTELLHQSVQVQHVFAENIVAIEQRFAHLVVLRSLPGEHENGFCCRHRRLHINAKDADVSTRLR